MEEAEARFRELAGKLAGESPRVTEGKMMSSPGIRYREKVFAFFHDGQMIFRLGKSFDPADANIETYSLLNPFKNKPPLAGWFVIPFSYGDQWEALARQAMSLLAGELDRKGSNS